MAVSDRDIIFTNKAILDTNIHTSLESKTGEFVAETITFKNTHDQQVNFELFGYDDDTWYSIGTWSVPAGDVTLQKDYETVSDWFEKYKVEAKCSVAPTEGVLNMRILKSGGK